MGTLNPGLKNFKPVFDHFNKINQRSERFIANCKNANNPTCLETLNLLLKNTELILESFVNSPTPDFSENHPADQILVSFNRFQEVRNSLLDTYLQLFQFSFFYQANIQTSKLPEDFIKLFDKAYNEFNIYLIESSDIRFQEEFLAYWNGFIKPVSQIILAHNEKSYFIRNLNDFNLRWNVLNVELTKRNKQVPKQVETLLKIMHNRWNNILKVTLR